MKTQASECERSPKSPLSLAVDALEEAKKLAKLAESLTGCRSDDDYVWGLQEKFDTALSALKEAGGPVEPGHATKVIDHARKMSDALLKLRPLGGSEMFTRIVTANTEEYYADPAYCAQLIDELRARSRPSSGWDALKNCTERLQSFLDTFGDIGGCVTQADINDWRSLSREPGAGIPAGLEASIGGALSEQEGELSDLCVDGELSTKKIEAAFAKMRAKVRALFAEPQGDGWRDIEHYDAEMGSVIIAANANDARGTIVGEAKPDEHGDWWWAGEDYGDNYAETLSAAGWSVTHFQPLPSPPAPQEGK